MQIMREVREIDSDEILITIPSEYRHQKLEIIVSSIESPDQDNFLAEKLRAIDELNGLIADQSDEDLDEFDRIIKERNPFRKNPIQL